jgi:uncharacterized protein
MQHPFLDLLIFLVATIAGGVAALSGFGIGSILTPLLATAMGMKVAVAAVSIPHFVATSVRLWNLRRHVDRRTMINFGIFSAVGSLLGALFESKANSPALSVVFGALLMFAGVSGLLGWMERVRFGSKAAWIAGFISGFFGGLVGNQGGIRSAALMAFPLDKERLVATATAIGVIVDFARMPVYVAAQGHALASIRIWIVLALAGCLVGTFWGVRLLGQVPARVYRPLLSGLICALGVWMVVRGVF